MVINKQNDAAMDVAAKRHVSGTEDKERTGNFSVKRNEKGREIMTDRSENKKESREVISDRPENKIKSRVNKGNPTENGLKLNGNHTGIKIKSRVSKTNDLPQYGTKQEIKRVSDSKSVKAAGKVSRSIGKTIKNVAGKTSDTAEKLSDADYAGIAAQNTDTEYTGTVRLAKQTIKMVTAVVVKELLIIAKAIVTAMTNVIGLCMLCITVVVISVTGNYDNIMEDGGSVSGRVDGNPMYEYHSYNQHNYTGQANKACGVTAVASALRSLGQPITPDMLEEHNNGKVGLFYGADAWVNNNYPVEISKADVSADTINAALDGGALCVVYLHNNCEVSNGSSQWNTGRNVSGSGCHWITLIGYTNAGLLAALDPADGTGNEEFCEAENCEGGTSSKAISMEEVMESCSNIYVIRPTTTVTDADDEVLLAALIYSEAGASYEDRLAVGTVVMNRLDCHLYGAETLEDVIYEPNQFEGTKTSNFRNAMLNGAPEQCRQIAHAILYEGKRSSMIPSSCISFMAQSISEEEMRRRTGCTHFLVIDNRFGW